MAAATACLATVAGLLGWAGIAVYPWSVYAPLDNGQAGGVFGGIVLLLLAGLAALGALFAGMVTIIAIRDNRAPARHAGDSARPDEPRDI